MVRLIVLLFSIFTLQCYGQSIAQHGKLLYGISGGTATPSVSNIATHDNRRGVLGFWSVSMDDQLLQQVVFPTQQQHVVSSRLRIDENEATFTDTQLWTFTSPSTFGAFDKGNRDIWYISTNGAASYLVRLNLATSQVLSAVRFTDRIFYNLEFDDINRRLLALSLHGATAAIQFISISVDDIALGELNGDGLVQIIVPSLRNDIWGCEIGISTFNPTTQSFYAIVRAESRPFELVTYLVTVSADTGNIDYHLYNYTITALQYAGTSNDLLAVTLELSNSTENLMSLSIIDPTTAQIMSYLVDLSDYDSDGLVGALIGASGIDSYLDQSYFWMNSPIGHLIIEYDPLQAAHRGFFYPVDALFLQVTSFSSCEIGQFENKTSSGIYCTDCLEGEYQDKYGQSFCKQCNPGTFGNGTKLDKCQLCSPGYAQPDSGRTSCAACQPGTSQPLSGQANCNPCKNGFHNNAQAATLCEPCLPGSAFIAPSGPSVCGVCPGGEFNPEFGSLGCSICTVGSFSPEGSQFCELCRIGSYNPDIRQPSCSPCPTGGLCDEVGMSLPKTSPGFFRSRENPFTFIACIPPEACLGDDRCGLAYEGPSNYCSKCAKGHFRLEKFCEPCPSNAELRLVIFLILSLVLVFTLLAFAMKYRRRIAELKKTGFYSSVVIGYSFFQITANMSSFGLAWPSFARQAMSWAWVTNFNADILASECSLELGYTEKYILIITIPIMLLSVVAIRWGILWIVNKMAEKTENWWKNKFPALFDWSNDISPLALLKRAVTWFLTKKDLSKIFEVMCQTVNASTTLLAIIYIFISGFVLSYFDCVSQPDGTYNLESNPEVKCFDSYWWKLFPVVLISLLVYVIGIPVGIFVFLYRSRNNLDDDRVYSFFGMLYIRYKSSLYFWELVIIARKLTIVIFRLFLNEQVLAQGILSMIFLIGFSGLQMWKRPYLLPRHNMMELGLVSLNAFMLFLGVIWWGIGFNEVAMNALILIIVLVGLIWLVVVFTIDASVHYRISRKVAEIELQEAEH